MNSVKRGLQKRIYVSMYAIFFLVMVLGTSVVLESCHNTQKVQDELTRPKPIHTNTALATL